MQDSKQVLTISTSPVEGEGIPVAELGLEPRPLTVPPAVDTPRPQKRAGRLGAVLKIIGSILLALVVILSGAGLWLVLGPWPQTRGKVAVAGLSAPVQVIRDEWGVPHIYAQNDHDLFFAQ